MLLSFGQGEINDSSMEVVLFSFHSSEDIVMLSFTVFISFGGGGGEGICHPLRPGVFSLWSMDPYRSSGYV